MTADSPSIPSGRHLSVVDGLRGVAILGVICFHYLYNAAPPGHANLYPFGYALNWLPIFKYGFLGVNLFFVISGFVIAMTLERCSGVLDFARRRFARLWPALLVCSILTYAVVSTVNSPFNQYKGHTFADFLPSLTLTPAAWWTWVNPNVNLI